MYFKAQTYVNLEAATILKENQYLIAKNFYIGPEI